MKDILSEKQIKKIEEFSNDTETVETVIALVDWVSDNVLDTIDINNDGFITEEELEVCATKCCCSCCPSIVKSCLSSFFLKYVCCEKKKKKVEINN